MAYTRITSRLVICFFLYTVEGNRPSTDWYGFFLILSISVNLHPRTRLFVAFLILCFHTLHENQEILCLINNNETTRNKSMSKSIDVIKYWPSLLILLKFDMVNYFKFGSSFLIFSVYVCFYHFFLAYCVFLHWLLLGDPTETVVVSNFTYRTPVFVLVDSTGLSDNNYNLFDINRAVQKNQKRKR